MDRAKATKITGRVTTTVFGSPESTKEIGVRKIRMVTRIMVNIAERKSAIAAIAL